MRLWPALALVACSFHLPPPGSNAPGSDGAATGDGASSNDGTPLGDGAAGSCTGVTSPGQRICADATHAAACELDVGTGLFEQVVIDRQCPPGSTCASGHCAPPADAVSCSKPEDCPQNVCDLFVVGGTIKGFCAAGFPGGTGPYSSCSPPFGNDPGCATGLCSLDGEDSAHRECLFAPCGSDNDCPNNQSCHLLGQPGTLEGVAFPAGFRACFS